MILQNITWVLMTDKWLRGDGQCPWKLLEWHLVSRGRYCTGPRSGPPFDSTFVIVSVIARTLRTGICGWPEEAERCFIGPREAVCQPSTSRNGVKRPSSGCLLFTRDQLGRSSPLQLLAHASSLFMRRSGPRKPSARNKGTATGA